VEWAYEHNAFIIEDDYSSHLRYDVKPISSLQGLAPDKVIYIGSFSKILLPSLRVAYMVLPKALAQIIHKTAENRACSVPFLIQKPLELFLQEGHFESHLRKMLRHLKKKHETLIYELQENFGDTISITGMNAGLHILLQLKRPVSAEDLITWAAKAGIYIPIKNRIWIDSKHSPYPSILLGFGGIALEDIPPAIRLLRKVWLDHVS
jgi:GntR family transcriptional regulator/MocR family aminotransferase